MKRGRKPKPYRKLGVILPESASDLLREISDHIGGKELVILCARTGLSGAPKKTLEQCGIDLMSGVTRERVRQIESQALRLLPADLRQRVCSLKSQKRDESSLIRKKRKEKARIARELRKLFNFLPQEINYLRLSHAIGFSLDVSEGEALAMEEIDTCRRLLDRFGIHFFGKYAECILCKNIKPLTEFMPSVAKGKHRVCLPCNARRALEYRKKNYEKWSATRREWERRNPDKMAAAQRNYHRKHPEKVREKYERWKALLGPQAFKELNRKHYEKRKERLRQQKAMA